MPMLASSLTNSSEGSTKTAIGVSDSGVLSINVLAFLKDIFLGEFLKKIIPYQYAPLSAAQITSLTDLSPQIFIFILISPYSLLKIISLITVLGSFDCIRGLPITIKSDPIEKAFLGVTTLD